MGAEHVLTEEDLGNMDKKALKVHTFVILSDLKRSELYLMFLGIWVGSLINLIMYFLLCTEHNLLMFMWYFDAYHSAAS